MPPPPAVLFSITGKPIRAASASASSMESSNPEPGNSGTPLFAAISRALCFRPKASRCSGRGPMKAMPCSRQPLGEAAVLGQKAVAGMHRLRAGCRAGRDDGVDVEIALRRGRRADPHRFVGVQHRAGKTVGIGIDRDRGDAHAAQRAADPRGDFAAVGNQNFREHDQSSPAW